MALVAAPGGHEHGGGAPAGAPEWLVIGLRVLLLTGTAVVAGLALVRPFATRFPARAVPVAAAAAAVTAVSLLAGILSGASLSYAVPQAAVTVVAALLLRRKPVPAAVAGLVLLGALVVEATLHLDGLAAGVAAAHWVAAAALLAAAAMIATAEPGERARQVRRFGWIAALGAVGFVATGLLHGWLLNVRPDAVSARSILGRLVAIEVLLAVAGVLACAIALRRQAPPVLRAGAVVLVAAVAAGAGLAAAPPLPASAAAGEPVVRTVALGGTAAQVVVVPHRPGRNLVWASGEGYRVGVGGARPVDAQRRPGSPGSWAVVDLPAGDSTLWVSRGGDRQGLRLHADPAVPALPGITGPRGPECLTAAVGSAIADGPPLTRCPDEDLSAAAETAVRGIVRSLDERGVPGIRLVADDSPRAAAARAAVLDEARRTGIPVGGPPDPLDARVVVGGWPMAEQVLITQQKDPAASGVYLAPWLGNGTLLGYSTGAVVALNYDTTEGTAAEYVAALDRAGIRELASPSGFGTWLPATGRPHPAGPARLYAAIAGFDLMGADPDMRAMHDMPMSTTGGWIPNGRMVAVSEPLTPG